MNDDAIERLRRENPFPETLPAPAIGPLLRRLGDRGSGSRARRHLAFGRVLAAAGVAVAVAVAVLAVVLVGRGQRPATVAGHHGPPVTSGPPSQGTLAAYLNAAYQRTVRRDPDCGFTPPAARFRGSASISDGAPGRALLSAFSVLRRPATAAETLPDRSDYLDDPQVRVVYVHYIRRARVVGRVSYYFIPAKIASPPNAVPLRCFAEQSAALQSLVNTLPPPRRMAIVRAGAHALAHEQKASSSLPRGPYDGVELLGVGPGGGGITCCDGAPDRFNQVSIALNGTTAFGVLPNRVASVSLYYTNSASQNVPTIIATATRTVTVKVVDNMYVVNLGPHGRPEPSAVVYRAANGTVLKAFDTNQ